MVGTAVVWALDTPGADPAEQLAGLSLCLRAVLSAQRAGVDRVLLLTSPGRGDLLRSVRADARVRVAVDELSGLRAVREPALLVRHDVIADGALYAELRRAEGPTVACNDGVVLGPALVTAELCARAGDDVEALLRTAVDDGAARVLETTAWAVRVHDGASKRRAFDALFEACRKPVDGIVARHLNRHVSIAISKRLVGTPITPNQTSVFTLLLGLVAAGCVARGGYALTLLGAALLQLCSIVDGVDGELARVRYQQSKLGEWLDNVSDDVTSLAFWIGLTLGAASSSRWLVQSGWIAVGAHVLYVALSYTEFVRNKSANYFDMEWRDRTKTGARAKLVELVLMIPRRDFFVFFCLCCAVFGVLSYMLPVIAVACVATLVAGVARNVRLAAGRRAAALRP
jgi:phosphatidylglycerophosphate synthase